MTAGNRLRPMGNNGEFTRGYELAVMSWEDYDALPSVIRLALQRAAIHWSPSGFFRKMRKMAGEGVPYDAQIRTIVALIESADREDLRVFAECYYERYRHEIPCIKARVVGPVPYQGSRRSRA